MKYEHVNFEKEMTDKEILRNQIEDLVSAIYNFMKCVMEDDDEGGIFCYPDNEIDRLCDTLLHIIDSRVKRAERKEGDAAL